MAMATALRKGQWLADALYRRGHRAILSSGYTASRGGETISGVKVEVADYGVDQSLQNVFLTLRENGGAEFCFLVGKDGCIEFARDVLLRIFGQSTESQARH
jgi:hypothetical protein